MKNNAIIKATLEDLFAIMDTRALVYVFEEDKGYQNCITACVSVYQLLGSETFMNKYGNYAVVGLNKTLGSTSILIKEV